MPDTTTRLEADLAACRILLADGSRSFLVASRLLPSAVRDWATALYAFCRVADDAIDLDPAQSAGLARLRDRLDRVYRGEPLDAAPDRAFAAVVERFGLPRALPEALLEGFEWDVEGRRYRDFAGLTDYAVRVAGSVGAMMSVIMDVRDPAALARACDLGVAMQFTNIARDVGEDARAGRVYLPLDWLEEAGIDPTAWLAEPHFDAALAGVIQRLLDEADVLYQRACSGIARLPRNCRPGIHVARKVYAEIGRELERHGLDSVSRRVRVSTSRKLALVGQALVSSMMTMGRDRAHPPLAQASYLVDAVTSHAIGAGPAHGRRQATVPGGALEVRLLRFLDLIERLERRDRGLPARSIGMDAPVGTAAGELAAACQGEGVAA